MFKKQFLCLFLIVSFNTYADLDGSNNIILNSTILATDINTKLGDVETAVSANADITNFTFTTITVGDAVSKTGLLAKFYTNLSLIYPNGNELNNQLGQSNNEIISTELNSLFATIINDVQSYSTPSGPSHGELALTVSPGSYDTKNNPQIIQHSDFGSLSSPATTYNVYRDGNNCGEGTKL